MLGRVEIGMHPDKLKKVIETQLSNVPQSVYDAAHSAASAVEDPNAKAIVAAKTLLVEILPTVVAIAIHENNGRLVNPFDRVIEEVQRLAMRR